MHMHSHSQLTLAFAALHTFVVTALHVSLTVVIVNNASTWSTHGAGFLLAVRPFVFFAHRRGHGGAKDVNV